MPHPLFVYLAVAQPDKHSKQATIIGTARDPRARLIELNNGCNRAAKASAPHWRLWLTIGLFDGKSAKKFKMLWRKKSRKPEYCVAEGMKAAVNWPTPLTICDMRDVLFDV
jgi:hypothetical protein